MLESKDFERQQEWHEGNALTGYQGIALYVIDAALGHKYIGFVQQQNTIPQLGQLK